MFIVSKLSGLVLDIESGVAEAGNRVILWPRKTGVNDNQRWFFQLVDNNYFHIVSALNPALVLDVAGGKAKNGAKLTLWTRNSPPTENQLFTWDEDTLKSALGDKLVLDCAQGKEGDGVIVWELTGGKNQQFYFAM